MVAGRGLSQPNTNKLGLFSEMGYTTIGEPYTAPNSSESSLLIICNLLQSLAITRNHL